MRIPKWRGADFAALDDQDRNCTEGRERKDCAGDKSSGARWFGLEALKHRQVVRVFQGVGTYKCRLGKRVLPQARVNQIGEQVTPETEFSRGALFIAGVVYLFRHNFTSRTYDR